jgi:predicted transcriptional regulator
MKLSQKERRALAELAKPMGQRDYRTIHGHTIHALERKGLYGFEGKSRRKRVTAAGRAELAVPDIFADIFKKKIFR